MQGKVQSFDHTSEVLKGNFLKDPHQRKVWLYTPPGYDPEKGAPLPLLWFIYGYSGAAARVFNDDPWNENIPQRLDRLINSGAMPPAACVVPDCFTRWGGSQFINSAGTGRYEDYLVEEIKPFIETKLPVKAHAILGKSSGGYGSFWLAARHPEIWQAAADHSGDSYFELCYLPDFPKALNLMKKHGGFAKFWAAFEKAPRRRDHDWLTVLNLVCMAACYSPNPATPEGFDWPMDLETCEIRNDVFSKWFAFDPVRMVPKYADNLKKLKLLFIDCGEKDEFNLQWGTRILSKTLKQAGVPHDLEFFDDGHMGITYRYDVSLPKLVKAIL
jgi:enterochelin esterase family protein